MEDFRKELIEITKRLLKSIDDLAQEASALSKNSVVQKKQDNIQLQAWATLQQIEILEKKLFDKTNKI